MSVLKIRDENGNVTEIAAIKGDSAYQIAVRNGFAGTEAEWLDYIYNIEHREYVDGLMSYGQKDIFAGKITNREATDFSFIKYGIPEVPSGSTVYTHETTLQEVLDALMDKINNSDSNTDTDIDETVKEILNNGVYRIVVTQIESGRVILYNDSDFSNIQCNIANGTAITLQDVLDNKLSSEYKAYLDATFVQKSGDPTSEPYDLTADSLHANTIYSNNKILSSVASDFSFIGIIGSDRTLQTELDDINDSIGEVDTALSNIISLQESYIGGESV